MKGSEELDQSMFFRSIVLPLVLIFLCISASDCSAKGSLYDLVVGGTIKTLAKVYVRTANLPKLKAKYIQKIAHMKEDKFQKHYVLFYDVYKELPPDLKQRYVFTDKATKSEVIHRIETVDKKDLIAIINKVPSDFIMRKTRHYSHKPHDQLPDQPMKNEMFLWRSIIQKV